MPATAFARVDGLGNLIASSPNVLGMQNGLDSPSQRPVIFGVYCFKLDFTVVSVVANSIAHPDDNAFGPLLYTAGPDITGQFTKDANGRGIECPEGFNSAAVVCRVEAGNGLTIPRGGFFVVFD
jgi:hypothetical protein